MLFSCAARCEDDWRQEGHICIKHRWSNVKLLHSCRKDKCQKCALPKFSPCVPSVPIISSCAVSQDGFFEKFRVKQPSLIESEISSNKKHRGHTIVHVL